MSERSEAVGLLRTLAEFRFELRRFLHFSESAAVEAGLQPQQHQLLLQVAGAPEGATVTIAHAAERLSLRHNSVVELVDRSEREGLLVRVADKTDGRRAILRVTAKGERVLRRLAVDHARELDELAPRLAKAMKRIGSHAGVVAVKANAGVKPKISEKRRPQGAVVRSERVRKAPAVVVMRDSSGSFDPGCVATSAQDDAAEGGR